MFKSKWVGPKTSAIHGDYLHYCSGSPSCILWRFTLFYFLSYIFTARR